MYQSCDLLVFCETWLNNKDDPNDYILEGFRPPFFYQLLTQMNIVHMLECVSI